MIEAELELQGHANTYMTNFNNAFSKFAEGPIMTRGFGQFDQENLDDLVNKYVNFYEKL